VLLYAYPCADRPAERDEIETYFPRASDELTYIEKLLGPVRILGVITPNAVTTDIDDPTWELEKPPEKPKRQEGEEGGEGEDEKKVEADEGED